MCEYSASVKCVLHLRVQARFKRALYARTLRRIRVALPMMANDEPEPTTLEEAQLRITALQNQLTAAQESNRATTGANVQAVSAIYRSPKYLVSVVITRTRGLFKLK